MTAKEAAIKFIRVYVERGDSIASLKSGQMFTYGSEYKASIGGHIFPLEYKDKILQCPKNLIKKVSSDKILIEEVGGKRVDQIFSLLEIYQEIKRGKVGQLSLI